MEKNQYLFLEHVLEDVVPFANGQTISFKYESGHLNQIEGVNDDGDVMSEIKLFYDNNNHVVEAQCASKTIPYWIDGFFSTVPMIGRFKYRYDGDNLDASEADMHIFKNGQIFNKKSILTSAYDNNGRLLSIKLNGVNFKTFEYNEDGLPKKDIDLEERCETNYHYNSDYQLSELIKSQNGEILDRHAFEYFGDRLAREFKVSQAGAWSLHTLHLYTFDSEDMQISQVARCFYGSRDHLLLRVHVPNPSGNQSSFTISSQTGILEEEINTIDNIDLYVYDSESKTARIILRSHKESVILQKIKYNESGMIDNIVNSARSFWYGLGIKSFNIIENTRPFLFSF